MVRKNVTLLFILLILCTSCERIYIKKADYLLKRLNLSEKTCCYAMEDNLFSSIHPDSITVAGFKKFIGKKKLSVEFEKQFASKILYCLFNDSSKIGIDGKLAYYACGKINIQKGISSYLVLGESVGGWLDLIMLNFKEKNLTSIVLVAEGTQALPGISFSKSQINYKLKSLLLVDRSFYLEGYDTISPMEEDIWSHLGILKPKERKYFYSSYTIDENGYVKTIPFEKEDFPGYMNY